MLFTLIKKSKTNYYNQYFKANMNTIKNTWKEIKSIITIKNLSSDISKSSSSNGSTITNEVEILNVFKVGFSPSKRNLYDLLDCKPFKNDEKCFFISS